MSGNEAAAEDIDRKKSTEVEPLLAATSSSGGQADRPRTVRHHRRALSGRSTRSGLSGQISFGPNYHPNIYPNSHDHFAGQAKQQADARARSRFVKALLVGIGLWIMIGLVFGFAGIHRAGWGSGNNRADYGGKPSVPQSDGQPVWCAKFDTPETITDHSRMRGMTMKSKAVFSIPLDESDSFFIHGKGSFAKGRISIGTTDSPNIQIEVAALTNDEALIDLMTVCHVQANPDYISKVSESNQVSGRHNVGLGIYTPAPEVGPYPDSDLEFQVHVNLPKHLLSISKFSIKGDLFTITTTDLSTFSIGQVDFTTTVASIIIDHITGRVIVIRTNNGHIEGSFTVSEALNIATTNGAIMSKVALALSAKSTEAIALPSSKYSDQHSVDSPTPTKDQPGVKVDVATINGAASVNYVEHPINLKLFSSVKSTNGRAHVTHTPAYEGEFEVETTWGSSDIQGPLDKSDPSGQGRDRQLFIKSSRDTLGYRHISGTVWWGEKDEQTRNEKAHSGHTFVKTTLGSARVVFQ